MPVAIYIEVFVMVWPAASHSHRHSALPCGGSLCHMGMQVTCQLHSDEADSRGGRLLCSRFAASTDYVEIPCHITCMLKMCFGIGCCAAFSSYLRLHRVLTPCRFVLLPGAGRS